MYDIWYNNRVRGKDVETYCLIKNGYFAPFFRTSAGTLVEEATTSLAGFRFSLRKELRE